MMNAEPFHWNEVRDRALRNQVKAGRPLEAIANQFRCPVAELAARLAHLDWLDAERARQSAEPPKPEPALPSQIQIPTVDGIELVFSSVCHAFDQAGQNLQALAATLKGIVDVIVLSEEIEAIAQNYRATEGGPTLGQLIAQHVAKKYLVLQRPVVTIVQNSSPNGVQHSELRSGRDAAATSKAS